MCGNGGFLAIFPKLRRLSNYGELACVIVYVFVSSPWLSLAINTFMETRQLFAIIRLPVSYCHFCALL